MKIALSFILALAFLVSPAPTFAQGDGPAEATVKIIAPDKAKVGDLIVIDLSESIGSGFDVVVSPTPPGMMIFDDGRIIVCGTGNKALTYTFMISCAVDGDSDIEIHKIEITGLPRVPVGPGDEVVEKVKDWVSNVKSPSKRDDALKLAQSFASVAIVIDQGTFSTPEELVRATATSNREALGDNLEKWTPFLDHLMAELKAMADINKLTDVEAHGTVWKEVAQGLREYADTL
jgi:hypothetical protein